MIPKQTIESVYDAFKRGEIPYIIQLVAPNAIWRQSTAVPWGVAEFFQKLDATMEATEFTSHENVEVGNEVLSFGNYKCRSRVTGKPASMDWMFRWRVENGKITMFDSYIDSGAIVAALS